jgi:hypothetical protein
MFYSLLKQEIFMIKLKRNGIKKSNRLQLKNSQKIYMILGLVTSLIASLALYINAERAGKRQEVWVTTTTIAAGQIIDKQSVELIRADLGQISMNYLDNKSEVIGKSALEPLAAGNLLKSESIGIKSNLRNVALRISNGHLPPSLKANDWVDIWFSDPIKMDSTLIIPKTSVVWVDEINSNFGGVTTVVVAVPEMNVLQLVNSARTDGIDLVQREN